MIQIHKTPKFLRWIYPRVTWSRKSENEIFLTFDDGPDPEVTIWVLDLLRKYQAKGTFFCVGENVARYPDVMKELVEEGHGVANHTQHHLKGWNVTTSSYLEDISFCQEELVKITGIDNQLFRPPYGRIKRQQIRDVSKNFEIVMWSHLSWDFDCNLNTDKSIRKLKKAKPGSIIVFHDSKKSFENLKTILPRVLEHWSSLGIKFSTL